MHAGMHSLVFYGLFEDELRSAVCLKAEEARWRALWVTCSRIVLTESLDSASLGVASRASQIT